MADKTVVVRIVVRANQFSSGLKGAAADTQQFAVDVERSTQRAGSSALALGAASATAGKLMLVGIGGAMVVSAKAAIDFESSLVGVAKTTDLAGSAFAKAGSPLAAFGEGLRSLSMRIPLNVNDLARIAELGGQLGVEVPNLIEFTEVMAALGVSTNLGAEEAATGLARFTNIMGTTQDQFGRLGSIVVDLGNNLATTESEILTFGLRLAPIGKTVGLTEEEVLGLAGALTSLGIPAERGGTALQRFFLDMQGAVDSGGESLEAFASAARMSVDEFVAVFEESPAQAFTAILQGLQEVQDEGGNAAGVLNDLGVIQQRSIQVLLAASSGWEGVAEAIDVANVAGEEGNALFEEAARRYGTSASQIQILSNAFTDLRIEIGNALLGSGGLSAGIDFLREFARIIKDNLPMLGRLVKVMAAVAAIRIGAGLAEGLHAGITQFRAMRVGVEGVTRASAALRLGMLGVNAAVFGAVAIAAILVANWAAAAAKAAELRRQARLLQEQIEQGVDPVDAMVAALKEQDIITEDVTKALNAVGLSNEDFARKLLSGESNLKSFNTELGVGETANERLAKMLGITVEEVEAMGLESESLGFVMAHLNRAIRDASIQAEGFFSVRTSEIRNAFIEAGLGIRFTTDELDRMAEHAARTSPFDMDPGDIASRIASFTGYPEMTLAAEEAAAAMSATNKKVALSWTEMVLGLEDGSNRIDDFYDTLSDGAVDFQNTLQESFDEVKETVMGGFPTWDEYEQKTIESLDAVIASQDAYLEDLRDGFELQEQLTGQVSDRVLEFIKGLDPATKGALARLRQTNETGFNNWVASVDENLGEAGELVNDFWGLELPAAQEQGFATLFGLAVERAKEFGLPGEQTAQAIMDGLSDTMQTLTEEQQADFMGFISTMFQNEEFLNSIGLDIGDPIVQGILQALGTLPAKAEPVISSGAKKVRDMFEKGYEVSSPSAMTERVGMNLTRGLFVGMDDELDRQLRATANPVMNIVNPNPTVNVSVPVSGGSRDLHIYYPEHKDDDIVDAIQKSSFLDNLQRAAETTAGFN